VALIKQSDLLPHHREEIMWRTGTSKALMEPETAWKRMKIIEPLFVEGRMERLASEDTRTAESICYARCLSPFGNDRYFCFKESIYLLSPTRTVVLCESIEKADVVIPEKCVEGRLKTGFLVDKCGYECKVVYSSWVDLKGSIPSFLANMVAGDRAFVHANLLQHVKSTVEAVRTERQAEAEEVAKKEELNGLENKPGKWVMRMMNEYTKIVKKGTENQNGIAGSKPAREFTREERGG